MRRFTSSSSSWTVNFSADFFTFTLFLKVQGVSRVSAKAKLKNSHFTGGYRGSKPFFLTLQSGSKFSMDKRSIKDVYFSPFQQQEKSAKLQILHICTLLAINP